MWAETRSAVERRLVDPVEAAGLEQVGALLHLGYDQLALELAGHVEVLGIVPHELELEGWGRRIHGSDGARPVRGGPQGQGRPRGRFLEAVGSLLAVRGGDQEIVRLHPDALPALGLLRGDLLVLAGEGDDLEGPTQRALRYVRAHLS